ncbi:MAG: ankyrin repeat domain-containing protein [Candidatus Symbiodolus clandestinus]
MLALKRGQKAAEMVTILMQALPESLRPDIVLFAALLRKGITQQERIMAIQNALDQGAHINAQDSSDQENTVLHQAALKGEPEVVQFLLAHGSDAQIKNRQQEIPLMSALKKPMCGEYMHELEKYRGVTSLLEQALPAPLRANCRLFATLRRSLFEYFNQPQRMAAIREALAQGADINAQDCSDQDNTVLHQEVLLEEEEVVRFLLEHGANSQIKNAHGELPVMLALKREVSRDFKNPQLVTRLMEALPAGLRANMVLFNALLPRRPCDHFTQPERITAIQQALEQGADINAQDSSDQENTALHQAVQLEEIAVVQFLLEQGANLRLKNRAGQDPITLAMKTDWRRGQIENWALFTRFIAADSELAHHLISELTQTLPTPLNPNTVLMAALLQQGLTQPARIDIIRKALEDGADINAQNRGRDNTALHQAALQGEPEVVQFLLEQGADTQSKNKEQETPLRLALQRRAAGQPDREPVIELLATGQTEPSTANLMLFAAMWPKTITQPQRISLIQEALAQGADINAQDSSGQEDTALHQAARLEEIEVLQFLLEQGADPTIKNQYQQDVLMLSSLQLKIVFADPENMATVGRICMKLAEFNDAVAQALANPMNNRFCFILDKNRTAEDFVDFINAFSQYSEQPWYQQVGVKVARYLNTQGVERFNFTAPGLSALVNVLSPWAYEPSCQQAITQMTQLLQPQPSCSQSLPQMVQALSASIPLSQAGESATDLPAISTDADSLPTPILYQRALRSTDTVDR